MTLAVLACLCGCAPVAKQQAHATTPPRQVATRFALIAPATTAPALASSTMPVSIQSPFNQPMPGDSDPRDTIPFLASDELEGRIIGSVGNDRAADFIAAEFQTAGLKPLPGQNGYFQSFPYRGTVGATDATTLSIGSQKLTTGKDFVPLGFSADGTFAGNAAFVGYGVSAPEVGYDDYAGIDVKGKMVLLIRFEPVDDKGNGRLNSDPRLGWSSHATFEAKAKNAAAHGAAGVLLVDSPDAQSDDLLNMNAVSAAAATIPILNIKRSVAEQLLHEAGAPDLKRLKQQIDTKFQPQSKLLEKTEISGRVQMQRSVTPMRNVMACIPGSGPHADEFVVVGAHYDHLGKGQMGHQFGMVGSIYHGADDNASGTATVIALAAKMAHAAAPPARTIVFVCFTGEEEGLIGSEYFVAHPPIPLDKTVAMLNFDMVGRLKNQMLYVGGQGTAVDFDSVLTAAQQHSKLTIKSVGRGGLGPSDHMSFATRHVPVMFLFTGLHSDYHRPTDVASKINYDGMAEILNFAGDLALGMTRMPHDPYLVEADKDSFSAFGLIATGLGAGTRPSGPRAILGIIPNYGSEDSRVGVVISGTTPLTPAEKAGLQNGDLIVQFGQQKIENLMDLTAALNRAKPGDKITLKYVRGEQTVSTEITLGQRSD
jgi:hypothetical protein